MCYISIISNEILKYSIHHEYTYPDRQEKANAGKVTQKIHPPLKQSTLIHTKCSP